MFNVWETIGGLDFTRCEVADGYAPAAQWGNVYWMVWMRQ